MTELLQPAPHMVDLGVVESRQHPALPGAPDPFDGSARWANEHTILGTERAKQGGITENYHGTEYYVGSGKRTPIVNRGTTRFEGVADLRTYAAGGPVIEVDSGAVDHAGYDALYAKFNAVPHADFRDETGHVSRRRVLDAVYNSVNDQLKYDLARTRTLQSSVNSNGVNEVNLNEYLIGGYAICHGMALAAGWLGNKVSNAGWLSSAQAVEVNQREIDDGQIDAHSWMRDTPHDPNEDVIIIDPAQHIHHTLQEIYEMGAKGESVWNYFHEGEVEKYKAQYEAQQAVVQAGELAAAVVQADVVHTPDPTEQSIDGSELRLLGRLAERLTMGKQIEAAPIAFDGSSTGLDEILASIPADSPNRLTVPSSEYVELFNKNIRDEAIATQSTEDGGQRRLTHLVAVGQSIVGVVSKLDHAGTFTELSLVRLPYGAQGISADGGTQLLFKSPSQALNRGQMQINVGRGKEGNDADIAGDDQVSRKQFGVIVTSTGHLLFQDRSSANGGVLLDMSQANANPRLSGLFARLQENPSEWAA